MWSASEAGIGFCATLCFAPCQCITEATKQQPRISASSRNQPGNRPRAMEDSFTFQYRERDSAMQCKSVVPRRFWPTLGKTHRTLVYNGALPALYNLHSTVRKNAAEITVTAAADLRVGTDAF